VTQTASAGPRAGRGLLFALALLALVRLVSLPWYPLMDNTEARYAEIARRMLAMNDWVTPWFAEGVPFWGKPPLSFWATQVGYTVFGVGEWGARLPHYLLGVGVVALAWSQARTTSQRAAWHTAALLAGSALFVVASGAVMTDMAMTLGNTMVMVGFWHAWRASDADSGTVPGADALTAAPSRRVRTAPWVPHGGLIALGATIGLLAKGPVSLVLWGLPLLGWVLLGGRLRRAWRSVAWLRGTLLVVALTLPWYLLAESRTPGFLHYFIVGEHWQRFTTAGWGGDLYGSAHSVPHGSIWLLAVGAVLPWSLLLPLAAWIGLRGRDARAGDAPAAQDGETSYLLAWGLMPCLFFSTAGNVLWTYVLPGLPALALLAGRWTASRRRGSLAEGVLALGLVSAAVITLGLLAAAHAGQRSQKWSAQSLVQDFQRSAAAGERLYFVGNKPFSADFYAAGQARAVARLDALPQGQPAWVALTAEDLAALPPQQRARLDHEAAHGTRVLARWH